MAPSLPPLLATLGLSGALVLSGCLGIADRLNSSAIPPVDDILRAVQLREEGGFAVDVPIDVFLLGFDPAVATALAAKLQPAAVDHSAMSFHRSFPPGDGAMPLGSDSLPAPTLPRAVYRVVDLDGVFETAFFQAAAGWTVADSRYDALDANAAEAHLAEALAAAGFPLDRNAPAFVILHGGDAMGDHAWRYTFSHGYLEPIRAFGELEPLLVYDVSAKPDPFVVGNTPSGMGLVFATVFGPSVVKGYNHELEASGDKTVEALVDLVADATHYRFLKGPIYPISTKPCHHVTLLLAVHQTTLTEALPGHKKAKEWVDVPGLEGAFENLTGDEVTVELKVLTLPQDDPVLDALSRGAGSFATLDALRWYLDENWEKFVTVTPPCEEYLSVLLYGDPATVGAFGGIGTYDVKRSHRISFSLVSDQSRIRGNYEGPGEDLIRTTPESRRWNYVNLLYSHETGHLFGQHHPQHLSKTDADSPANDAFQSVYSVMSYQTVDRIHDFGVMDYAQWTRNRVGYTIAEAQTLGLHADPAFAASIGHLERGHWAQAHLALEPLLGAATADGGKGGHSHGHGLPDHHFLTWHDHPWG